MKITIPILFNGFTLNVETEGPDEAWSDYDSMSEFFRATTAFLKDCGAKPAGAVATSHGTPATPTPAKRGGGACPVHGTSNIGPGYNNQGWQCKAFSPQPEDWSKDKVYIDNNGDERWYCKSKGN